MVTFRGIARAELWHSSGCRSDRFTLSAWVLLALTSVAGVLMTTSATRNQSAVQPPPAQAAPPTDSEYWTPERLRNARPLDLPTPKSDTGKSTGSKPLNGTGSVSGSGSPGQGTIVPDGGALLFNPKPLETGIDRAK